MSGLRRRRTRVISSPVNSDDRAQSGPNTPIPASTISTPLPLPTNEVVPPATSPLTPPGEGRRGVRNKADDLGTTSEAPSPESKEGRRDVETKSNKDRMKDQSFRSTGDTVGGQRKGPKAHGNNSGGGGGGGASGSGSGSGKGRKRKAMEQGEGEDSVPPSSPPQPTSRSVSPIKRIVVKPSNLKSNSEPSTPVSPPPPPIDTTTETKGSSSTLSRKSSRRRQMTAVAVQPSPLGPGAGSAQSQDSSDLSSIGDPTSPNLQPTKISAVPDDPLTNPTGSSAKLPKLKLKLQTRRGGAGTISSSTSASDSTPAPSDILEEDEAMSGQKPSASLPAKRAAAGEAAGEGGKKKKKKKARVMDSVTGPDAVEGQFKGVEMQGSRVGLQTKGKGKTTSKGKKPRQSREYSTSSESEGEHTIVAEEAVSNPKESTTPIVTSEVATDALTVKSKSKKRKLEASTGLETHAESSPSQVRSLKTKEKGAKKVRGDIGSVTVSTIDALDADTDGHDPILDEVDDDEEDIKMVDGATTKGDLEDDILNDTEGIEVGGTKERESITGGNDRKPSKSFPTITKKGGGTGGLSASNSKSSTYDRPTSKVKSHAPLQPPSSSSIPTKSAAKASTKTSTESSKLTSTSSKEKLKTDHPSKTAEASHLNPGIPSNSTSNLPNAKSGSVVNSKKRPIPVKTSAASSSGSGSGLPKSSSVVQNLLAKLKQTGDDGSQIPTKLKEKEKIKETPKATKATRRGGWSDTFVMTAEQAKQYADTAPQREAEAKKRAAWRVNPVNLQEAKDAYRLDSTQKRIVKVAEYRGIMTEGLPSKMVASILGS